jgi:Phosphotransferase enzyme family
MTVEETIFGDDDPVREIVAFLDEEPAETLFVEASVGVVAGFRLQDGRGIVVKVHQPSVSAAYLKAVHTVQGALADAGFPAPRPLAGPRPLARGYATVEELLDRGGRRDGHDAAVRTAMARALARLIELAPDVDGIDGGILERTDALWPRPHSPLFDFEATRGGTEWIDDYAERSRSLPVGDVVLGHGDWSVKHFRFAGDEITAIYDWDSLIRTDEPRVVGQAAATHTATWYIPTTVLATPDEARAFVAEYEEARGRAFTPDERARLAAAATYNVAYGARCESCGDPTATSFAAGSQRDTLARYGEEYLRL